MVMLVALSLCLRGWWNTVELVLLEISNSTKPCPSVSHAYTTELRPVIVLFEPDNLDEASNLFTPTNNITASRDTEIFLASAMYSQCDMMFVAVSFLLKNTCVRQEVLDKWFPLTPLASWAARRRCAAAAR